MVAACAAVLLLSAGPGCNATTRYKALSFLFDGVPPPPPPPPAPGEEPAATAAVAKPSQKFYREHGPYGAKLCTACHDSASSNSFIVPRDQLCAHCHELKLDKKYLHGPVGTGKCVACHDPHSSQYRYLLVAAPGAICLRCHEAQAVAENPIHEGVGDTCLECHEAHQSDDENFLK